MKRPSFQFYPADWRKHVGLQSCSMGAQGLWINAIAIAHECEPYGYLTVGGKPMTDQQLAKHLGISVTKTRHFLNELVTKLVAKRDENGTIFSARMVKDEATRNKRAAGGSEGAEHGKKGAKHGKKGGRPRLVKGGYLENIKPPPSSSSSSSKSPLPPEGSAVNGDGIRGRGNPDVVRQTVPGSNARDPELARLDAESKQTTPPPDTVRQLLKNLKGKKA